MRPVLQELPEDNQVAQAPTAAYITFTVLSMLVAPIMFIACIFPEQHERFKTGLHKALTS